MKNDIILNVSNLVVSFNTENGRVRAVDGVGFKLRKATTLGIVGESGCGKSVTALSIMGLLPKPSGQIEYGTIEFKGQDLVSLMGKSTLQDKSDVRIGAALLGKPNIKASQAFGLKSDEIISQGESGKLYDMQKIRGRQISMIFQEPMTALNPVQKIGVQMNEVYQLHFPQMRRRDMDNASISMLAQVGIATPDKVIRQYPHELSGGMRQRVMIAMALSSKPDILIADEPTTALDVTVQAQILDMVNELQTKLAMSVILITHDLGVIAENCDDAVVMYGGRVAERAGVAELFSDPLHPYTQGLLKSIPGLSRAPRSILPTIKGQVPSLEKMPSGCRFSNRCDHVMEICRSVVPFEIEPVKGHFVACHKYSITP
ncbi:MAG: ABC transporter ATP-binding protein, partial [Desulfamplus sp.]|nr:ABC transporter ATP-binding protein [Desulfamplus sp.]